jgi:hypothetical protein
VKQLNRGTDVMADTFVPVGSSNIYNVAVEDFWQLHSTASCFDNGGNAVGTVNVFLGRRHGQTLTASTTQLSGSASFASETLLGASVLGEGLSLGSFDFSRTISQ